MSLLEQENDLLVAQQGDMDAELARMHEVCLLVVLQQPSTQQHRVGAEMHAAPASYKSSSSTPMHCEHANLAPI